jgi:hypothetical protein
MASEVIISCIKIWNHIAVVFFGGHPEFQVVCDIFQYYHVPHHVFASFVLCHLTDDHGSTSKLFQSISATADWALPQIRTTTYTELVNKCSQTH